jgi:hypothetical protein
MADRAVLLVEGKDDEHVFYALFNHNGIPRTIRIKDKQGIDNLLETLEVELLGSELKQLGIVVDADTNLSARWQSLTAILRNSGYAKIPALPDPDGTIIVEDDRPVVGIWIMPDNSVPGMLENFVKFLVPQNDLLWDRVVLCINSIPETERLFRSQHLIKAQIHTWLAWQEEPGTPLGSSITKRYLDADTLHAQKLIEWIRKLFPIDQAL